MEKKKKTDHAAQYLHIIKDHILCLLRARVKSRYMIMSTREITIYDSTRALHHIMCNL